MRSAFKLDCSTCWHASSPTEPWPESHAMRVRVLCKYFPEDTRVGDLLRAFTSDRLLECGSPAYFSTRLCFNMPKRDLVYLCNQLRPYYRSNKERGPGTRGPAYQKWVVPVHPEYHEYRRQMQLTPWFKYMPVKDLLGAHVFESAMYVCRMLDEEYEDLKTWRCCKHYSPDPKRVLLSMVGGDTDG